MLFRSLVAKVARPATLLSMMAQINIVNIFIHPGGKRRRVPVKILVQSLENILIVLTRKQRCDCDFSSTRQQLRDLQIHKCS